ncbi:MAG: polyprenyl synthetase family protein [Lachnospiraceae bacterium]|nr:polyprenyl synthetase family protein [Lachnospiraceae bacterium]
MNWQNEHTKRIEEAESIIKSWLPEEKGYQKKVMEAMNYSILAGGKRIRPVLMLETYRIFGGKGRAIEPFLAAIEMIHTYSLVHDDLPAMDNDEYRRGRKTTHVVYGEGMAILAGDGLLNLAFETAVNAFMLEPDNPYIGKALQILAAKAGIYGMIGGQTADIEAEGMSRDEVTEELLLFIHEHKTAALIQAAMMIGAVLAGADETKVKTVEKIAYNIGIAFQIQDDILDVTSSLEALGKAAGSDEKNAKVTYVTLKGLEQAAKDVENLSREAIDLLETLSSECEWLKQMINYLITREK